VVYVTITALGNRLARGANPDWVDQSWMRCPFCGPAGFSSPQDPMANKHEFVVWFRILIDVGMTWEAFRILKSLRPIVQYLPTSSRGELLIDTAEKSQVMPELRTRLMIAIYQARYPSRRNSAAISAFKCNRSAR
jgi:hypothetical protein